MINGETIKIVSEIRAKFDKLNNLFPNQYQNQIMNYKELCYILFFLEILLLTYISSLMLILYI